MIAEHVTDIDIENGDYLRIQNMTLGYDFKRLWKNCPLSQLRLYVSVQNLYTFTGYKGMDPEVGFGRYRPLWRKRHFVGERHRYGILSDRPYLADWRQSEVLRHC